MRCGTALVAFALLACVLQRAEGRRLSPSVSATVFAADDKHSRPPLAVLRAAPPDDHGASIPTELKIYAEDPKWAYQVEEFVVSTRADAKSVEAALDGVRDVSWAAGRTFRRKHVVLLAFAEDAESDGGENTSSRLVTAVKAVSRHTTDAHFVLVADGFELDVATREIMESVLGNEGWKSFTAVEVPEFEGFSSAINRAAEIVGGNSMVAVLSTSALLLPASTVDAPAPAAPINGIGSQDSASDIFVAFEQLRSNSASSRSPWASSLGKRTGAEFGASEDSGSRRRNSGAEGARYDQYGHVRHPNGTESGSEGLLMTVSPSRVTADRAADARSSRQAQQRGRGASSWGKDEGEGLGRREAAEGRQTPNMRLRDAAPLPLLVFDTETFSALGELDEQFAFQGGVAEWISRARMGSIDQGGAISAEMNGSCCCDASSRRCRGSIGSERSETGRDLAPGPSCSDVTVQHLHAREWGKRFVGLWPDEGARPPKASSLDTGSPDSRRSGVGWLSSDDVRGEEVEEPGFGPGQMVGVDEAGQRRNTWEPRTGDGVTVDQWTRLPPAKLEALIQADADLFFLPLVLSRRPSASASRKEAEADSAGLCTAFHSEWMQRAPDKTLERDALLRRERFPAAVVVVVHDDISLMRASLEAVAVAVELILVVVSENPWHGDTQDISPTLNLLDEIVADVDSPTYGKLQVEVGSWATEAEQREHGNTVIRENPRNFSRVVVMDTDEFWHPVELTKALVLVAQHPEAVFMYAEMNTFWGSVRSVVSPPENLRALWLVDPHRCWWSAYRDVRCTVQDGREHGMTFNIDRSLGVVHHLSYVRVDEDLRRKMGTFSHAGEEESGWYERSWLGWAANNSLTDLHPTQPEAFKRVAVQPLIHLPPALRTLHLDARKGRDAAFADGNLPIGSTHWSLTASTTSSTRGEGGSAAVHRDARQAEDEACGNYRNGTVQSSGSVCLPRMGSDSRRGANGSVGSAEERRRGVRVGGCEGVHVAHWTERQRTMCLVPDVGGETV